jgi:hypothetical protein
MPRSRPVWAGAVRRTEDAVLLLVVVLAVPLLILLIGMPIVLGLRAAIELLSRL